MPYDRQRARNAVRGIFARRGGGGSADGANLAEIAIRDIGKRADGAAKDAYGDAIAKGGSKINALDMAVDAYVGSVNADAARTPLPRPIAQTKPSRTRRPRSTPPVR